MQTNEIKIEDQIKSEYNELEDSMRADISHLDLKIADIETHIQSINIQIKQIETRMVRETDPVKKLNLNKAFSYLIRIYAELVSASHGFFSSKLSYRKNQEMALRNKLRLVHIDIPKISHDIVEDLTIPKLVKMINSLKNVIDSNDKKPSLIENDMVNKIKSIDNNEKYSLE